MPGRDLITPKMPCIVAHCKQLATNNFCEKHLQSSKSQQSAWIGAHQKRQKRDPGLQALRTLENRPPGWFKFNGLLWVTPTPLYVSATSDFAIIIALGVKVDFSSEYSGRVFFVEAPFQATKLAPVVYALRRALPQQQRMLVCGTAALCDEFLRQTLPLLVQPQALRPKRKRKSPACAGLIDVKR